MRILLPLLLVVPCLALVGCSRVTCDEDHPAVQIARKLTSEQLNSLTEEVRIGSRTRLSEALLGIPVRTNLPKFDTSPLKLKLYYEDHGSIALAGCFDHGVYLDFDKPKEGPSRVVLSWGEAETRGQQTLWPKN